MIITFTRGGRITTAKFNKGYLKELGFGTTVFGLRFSLRHGDVLAITQYAPSLEG